MTRTIANTYICINTEGQTLSIIARTGNEAHNIAIGFLRKANIVSVRRVFKSGKLGKEILKIKSNKQGTSPVIFSLLDCENFNNPRTDAPIRHVAPRNIIPQQPTSCQEKNAKISHKNRNPDLCSLPIDKMK